MYFDSNGQLIEALLVIGRMLGMSRSVAIVFAILYSHDKPCKVEEIASEGNLSRSAVSLALRELDQFGAIQEVAVLGERSRRYCGQPDLSRTVTAMLVNRLQNPLGELRSKLGDSSGSPVRLEQARSLLNTIDDVLATIHPQGEL